MFYYIRTEDEISNFVLINLRYYLNQLIKNLVRYNHLHL